MSSDPSAWQTRAESVAPWVVVTALLFTRLATTIYYVEDPDSLRFALATAQFSIPDLQPHFPGYPVFVLASRLAALGAGRFSVGFSLLGALSTVALLWAILRLARRPLASSFGFTLAGLVLVNPMLWLMGNRYMPDLAGAALAWVALAFFVTDRERLAFFLSGVLAGTRLSCLPLLLLPAILALPGRSRGDAAQCLGAGLLGVLSWLVPTVYLTGPSALWAAATRQSTGHFQDFGGTVRTEPDLILRLERLLQSLWADGLGGYWAGRDPSTLAVSAFLFAAFLIGMLPLFRTSFLHTRRLRFVAAAVATYLCWIFFFQNVVHKARHVLPLIPVLLWGLAIAIEYLARRSRAAALTLAFGLLASTGWVSGVLVHQHRSPSALAQVLESLRPLDLTATHVVANPLITNFLEKQGVEAIWVPVRTRDDLAALDTLDETTPVVTVGDFRGAFPRRRFDRTTFYHNPFVNRMWARLDVFVSGHERAISPGSSP